MKRILTLAIAIMASTSFICSAENGFVINNCPVTPVRQEPSEVSEQVTQLLFGEVCELVERRSSWAKIRSTIDGQEGWVSYKMMIPVDQKEAINLLGDKTKKQVIAVVMIPYLEHEDFSVGNVHVVFVPTYLNGNDGVLNLPYYDLLIGLDLTIFPSYYEPWGYTPLESMAFHVPTITTSLSGYGVWCEEQGYTTIDKGVAVIYRNDSNTNDVINHIVNTIEYYLSLTPQKVAAARKAAVRLALQAEWKNFFTYYREAYAIALKKAAARQ